MRTKTASLAAAALTAALLSGGCLGRDKICRNGEYPAKAVGNPTGRVCVRDGRDPPPGYVRYPAGKVPAHVDDEWDVYWRDKTVDESGTVVSS
ncbi:hypothetical protein KZZ52_30255 [Dactylosporangium sp. AC04546]|uniref:SCO0607 family lipoprotein n=1 Tax=Dactylosporangium sp. AC04546 TaxID=2862460 RepID=UPI001EDEB014|nr:hypothetical protein [Dactylosporangium sp. AC04546]WVK78279.1 hypothetical protein KZZ52_30255 [Dactylosporangium sp. AC04546]